MNSMQLKDKLRNIAKTKNIDFNTVLKFYVFDRFIVRLSKSKYKDNFIIKGGFLLSTLFGLENRSTMDIDSSIIKTDFTETNIIIMINSIINIELNDGVTFLINGIETIREEDEYGGYRVNLLFEFENIKEFLKLDVATGDLITPNAINYRYKLMLEDNHINVWSYNIETILAEKIETILSKVEVSSRMKDYYDIYLICSRNFDFFNKKHFKKAVENTFQNRKFDKNLYETLEIIKKSSILKKRWESYSNKHEYANNISFNEILNNIEQLIHVLEFEVIKK